MALNLPANAWCFVDANIWYYHFVRHPDYTPYIGAWLRRVEKGELRASSCTFVLAEALHRVMLTEVQQLSGAVKALAYVQKHPGILSSLKAYGQAAHAAMSMPIDFLPVRPGLITNAATISGREKLMTNDALIVAVMEEHGIGHLVTNDDDFQAVAGITIWQPR